MNDESMLHVCGYDNDNLSPQITFKVKCLWNFNVIGLIHLLFILFSGYKIIVIIQHLKS